MSQSRPRRLIFWQCPHCEKMHESPEKAQECIDRGFKHTVQVGDIVLLGYASGGVAYQYGWMDGDKSWIYSTKEDDSFPSKIKYAFYYVVTKIDQDRNDKHKPRIHMCTKALANQGNGWTFYDDSTPMADRDHTIAIKFPPWKHAVDPPHVVIEASKELIGLAAPGLI